MPNDAVYPDVVYANSVTNAANSVDADAVCACLKETRKQRTPSRTTMFARQPGEQSPAGKRNRDVQRHRLESPSD